MCGKWIIPYDIDEAVLSTVPWWPMKPFRVLTLQVAERTGQFGPNPGAFWHGGLLFPVRRESGRLGWSWFSIGIRIVVRVLLVHVLLRVFAGER